MKFLKSLRLVVLLFVLLSHARAEDVLFIGNSFTYTFRVPLLFEAVAKSKGKDAHTDMLTKGGIGWAYHVNKITEKTDAILKSKPWNFVAMQDYSTNATHVGFGTGGFFKYGELLYDKIGQLSPTATVILYETWSFPRAIEGYVPKPKPAGKTDEDEDAKKGKDGKDGKEPAAKAFKTDAEMYGEIHGNYLKLYEQLKAKDPKRKVLYAPVGTAFDACRKAHPEIPLFGPDDKHPSFAGSYLSACVFYAAIYNESPVGAAAPTQKNVPPLNPAWLKPLQEIAASVVLKK